MPRDHQDRSEVIILVEAIDLDSKRPQGYFSYSRSGEEYMQRPVGSGGHLLVLTCPIATEWICAATAICGSD